MAAVLGAVVPDQRIDRRPAATHRRGLAAVEHREQVRRQRPHRGRQQRHVDHRTGAGLAALEQRGRDAESQCHGAISVAHGAALADRVVPLGRGEDVAHSPARPERRTVVAGLVGVRAAHPEAMTPGIDQAGISRAQRVGVESQPAQRAGAQAGEEYVRGGEQFVQHGQPGLMLKVQRDGPLAPIGQGHRQIDAATVGADTLRRQPPVRVALEALDADRRRRPSRPAARRPPGRTPIAPTRQRASRRTLPAPSTASPSRAIVIRDGRAQPSATTSR